MIGGYLINVIFLPAFKVTPAGVCGLTFYTQSECAWEKTNWRERDKNLSETSRKLAVQRGHGKSLD